MFAIEYTGGAVSMTGHHSGIVAQIKRNKVTHPKVLLTHYMIHREYLAANKLSIELNTVTNDCVNQFVVEL